MIGQVSHDADHVHWHEYFGLLLMAMEPRHLFGRARRNGEIVPESRERRGKESVLVDRSLIPYSVSRDGRWLFATTSCGSASTSCDLWVVPLAGERKPYPLLETKFRESAPAICPTAVGSAYSSNESGRREIYVMSFPEPVGKWQVSANSGYLPVWSYDGRESYFTNADNTRMMAAEIRPGATFQNGPPKELFPIRMPPTFPVSMSAKTADF